MILHSRRLNLSSFAPQLVVDQHFFSFCMILIILKMQLQNIRNKNFCQIIEQQIILGLSSR